MWNKSTPEYPAAFKLYCLDRKTRCVNTLEMFVFVVLTGEDRNTLNNGNHFTLPTFFVCKRYARLRLGNVSLFEYFGSLT